MVAGNIRKGVTIFGVTGTADVFGGSPFWVMKDGNFQQSVRLDKGDIYAWTNCRPFDADKSYCKQPHKEGFAWVYYDYSFYTFTAYKQFQWTHAFTIPIPAKA